MNRITFPLIPRAQGAEVADLHSGLQLLLAEAAVLRQDPASRAEMARALVREQRPRPTAASPPRSSRSSRARTTSRPPARSTSARPAC